MSLKSCDIFRKIQSDVHPGTKAGGLFTVVAFIVGGLLLYHSLSEYYTEKYTTSLIIQSDDAEILPVRLNLFMSNAPCHVVSIKFHDEVEFEIGELEKQLARTRIDKDGVESNYTRNDNREEERNEMRKAIEAGEKCRLTGVLEMPKTPGFLKVQLLSNGGLVREMADLHPKINARYRLQLLQFGNRATDFNLPIVYQSQKVKQYIMDLEGELTAKQFVQDFTSDTDQVDFVNHIKIIPVRYGESKQEHTFIDKYRYSIRSGKSGRQDVLASITFLTEIEPINIVYHKVHRSAYQLVVRIFAIIGGVFATIGIINSLFQAVKSAVTGKSS